MNKLSATLLLAAALSTSLQAAAKDNLTFVINESKPQQTIEHFGASDAWSMFRIGLWQDKERNQVADWLFSTENDSQGKPLGIGLSIWRFNLGAGSAEQGRKANINRDTRTECLLAPDGTWDWTKQQGQRTFLKMAKERGVPYLLAFCNSAPVQFTKNGWATNTGRGGDINLKADCYDDFAQYIAKAVRGIEEHDGVHIDYISPVNEPDGSWNWQGPKQEGSPATNREIVRLAKELDKQLTREKQTTHIILNESSDLRCLLGIHNTSWERGNTLETLFNPDSTKTYVGKLSHVEPLIAAHSYWTNTPLDYMRAIRKDLKRKVDSLGIRYWQTELCIMQNDEEIGGGMPYDYSMKTALYVARVIHHDLVFGNACSWSWWRAVGGEYRDNLIRVYSRDGMKTGTPVDSKLMWAIGNYSRFVRPGAVRYDISVYDESSKLVTEGESDNRGILCSAYRNTDGSWVVVAINYGYSQADFNLSLGNDKKKWLAYRTSNVSAESLLPIGTCDGTTTLAPRSITTFITK